MRRPVIKTNKREFTIEPGKYECAYPFNILIRDSVGNVSIFIGMEE